MTKVLVLDSNASLTATLVRCLREVGIDAVGHTRIDTVLRHSDSLFDVGLVEAAYGDSLAALPVVRVVLMVTDPFGERELVGGRPMLRKPFSNAALMSVLHETVGPLHRPAPLLEALQVAHGDRMSVCFLVDDVVEPAEVYLIGGEIYDARRGGLRGEDALRALLERRVEICGATPIDLCERTIYRRYSQVMLDLLVEIEEAETGLVDAWRCMEGEETR